MEVPKSKEFSTKVDRVLFNRHSDRDNLWQLLLSIDYPRSQHSHNGKSVSHYFIKKINNPWQFISNTESWVDQSLNLIIGVTSYTCFVYINVLWAIDSTFRPQRFVVVVVVVDFQLCKSDDEFWQFCIFGILTSKACNYSFTPKCGYSNDSFYSIKKFE